MLPSLDDDRLVDRGHVAEGGGLVQGRGGRRLQRTQAREVVHLRGKVGESHPQSGLLRPRLSMKTNIVNFQHSL